jgi:hypothetical protein
VFDAVKLFMPLYQLYAYPLQLARQASALDPSGTDPYRRPGTCVP